MASLSSPPSSTTSIRRSRFILLILACIAVVAFLRFGPGFPEVLKGANYDKLSRANIVEIIKSQSGPVDEIYGLIHLVAGEKSQLGNVDAAEPIPLSSYSGTRWMNWEKEVEELNAKYPVVVFSKSYCPYSRRAKALLTSYKLDPPPKVVEVDLRGDGAQIKQVLWRLTRHSTFPNVLIRGHSLGGSDDLRTLHEKKSLRQMLEDAGVSVNGDVDEDGKT